MTSKVKQPPTKLCPFSVYDYPCSKTDCHGCTIMGAYLEKAKNI